MISGALSGVLALATAVAFVAVAAVLTAVRPLVVDRSGNTRLPTSTERDRLTSGVDGTHRVRLRIMERSRDAASAQARALGILPGYRYAFAADQLLASISTAAGRAVIAHEVGHHRGWHPLLRVVLPAVALIGWPLAIASDVPYALVGGAVALVPYVLLVCYIERQTEYRADAYAGEQVGYSAMREALKYLQATNPDKQQCRLVGLLATRPSLEDRIAHLNDLAGDENEDNTESQEPE